MKLQSSLNTKIINYVVFHTEEEEKEKLNKVVIPTVSSSIGPYRGIQHNICMYVYACKCVCMCARVCSN